MSRKGPPAAAMAGNAAARSKPRHNATALRRRLRLAGLLLLGAPAFASGADLWVHVEGRQAQGSLYLAVVPADQPGWEPVLQQLVADGERLRVSGLPPGNYAVQLFQDSNGNGLLDLSPRGLPREPVGFSGNPSLFAGKPTPQACRFVHGDTDSRIDVHLWQPTASRRNTSRQTHR